MTVSKKEPIRTLGFALPYNNTVHLYCYLDGIRSLQLDNYSRYQALYVKSTTVTTIRRCKSFS